ncbi:MAG: sulfatase-like hydrolase/transferase, partial [Octadecabacter sp.]|nr:sulfatase-like hydrolase/transferase [Octadecabacter sp.]
DYIGGAPSAFAGKGTFYTSHGFRSVDGYLDLRARSAVPEYRHYWGMYDDTVFSEVTARFESYTQEDEPFGLVALTLDSHDRTGRTISDSCEGYVYQDGRNASLNSVHCTDKLATEFIQLFLDSQAFEDTVLIVMSDHFARPNLAWDTLETAQRRNLLWAFGADIPAAVVSTPGTTIDAAPTVLRMLGGEISALGYGRDLLAQGSLLRQADVDPETLFREDRNYLNALWSYPSLSDGLAIDLADKKLLLGERFVGFPSLLHIDQDLNVTKFDFEVPGEKTLASYVVDLNHDERVLWVDECERVSLVLLAPAPMERYCAFIGSLGNERSQLLPLSDGENVDASLITAILQSTQPNWAYYDRRIGEMRRAVSFSDSAVVRYSPTNGMVGQIAIRSSGRANSRSWVLDRNVDVRVGLERGVNLIGFNDSQDPVRIGHRDTCGAGQEITSSVSPRLENIQETITKNKALFGAFAIVVHNSAVCFEVDPKLDVLFQGTNLRQWSDLYYDQPYVAVISGNGETVEFLGEANTALGVELTNFISKRSQRQLAWLPRVGHAGGVYQGRTYTNSIDALTANRDLYEIIEIDLSWTSDDELVCLHDWASDYINSPNTPLTLAEFEEVNAGKPEFELCTLDTLADWLRRNPGPRILIDAKAHAADVAQMLLDRYPELRDRFIPQIYQPDEYSAVRAMGYPDIVWTLYKYSGSDEEVLK